MPKLSDLKNNKKSNNTLKTDVRIGLIDESISEIFETKTIKNSNQQTKDETTDITSFTSSQSPPLKENKTTDNTTDTEDIKPLLKQHEINKKNSLKTKDNTKDRLSLNKSNHVNLTNDITKDKTSNDLTNKSIIDKESTTILNKRQISKKHEPSSIDEQEHITSHSQTQPNHIFGNSNVDENISETSQQNHSDTTDKSTDATKDNLGDFIANNKLRTPTSDAETKDATTDRTTDNLFSNTYNQGQTTDIDLKSTDKLKTHPRTLPRTKLRTRLDHSNIPERTYSELSKLQQKIIKTLYISCIQSSGTVTHKITINYLIEQTESSGESIKRTIRRLIQENFLDKYEWKDGRGGWTKYELHPYVYQNLFGIVGLKTTDKFTDITTDKLGTHPRTNPPSSSISFNNINKELTTNEYPFNPADVPGQQQLGPQFDSDWQNVDITPLASIGFSNNHLSQLFTKNELTPKQVQESINAFAFDLDENKRGEKIKTSPLNLFMGILKGGSPYNPPKNYESDEDRLLREQVEAEREKLEKRQQLQSELRELKYQNWLLDLAIEKKLEILDVPLKFFEKMPIVAIQEGLKKHFEMKVL